MHRTSIEELRESLLNQWNNGLIKGVIVPKSWNFNKFWFKFGQALYKMKEEEEEGLEDWQILTRVKEEAKNEVHIINGQRLIKCYSRVIEKNNSNYIEDLSRKVDNFADAFSKVAPLISKAASNIITKREEEHRLLNDVEALLSDSSLLKKKKKLLLNKAQNIDNDKINILLNKQGTQNLMPMEEGEIRLTPQQIETKVRFEKELQEFNNSVKELTAEESMLMNQALDYEQKNNYALASLKLRQLKELHENLKDRKEAEKQHAYNLQQGFNNSI